MLSNMSSNACITAEIPSGDVERVCGNLTRRGSDEQPCRRLEQSPAALDRAPAPVHLATNWGAAKSPPRRDADTRTLGESSTVWTCYTRRFFPTCCGCFFPIMGWFFPRGDFCQGDFFRGDIFRGDFFLNSSYSCHPLCGTVCSDIQLANITWYCSGILCKCYKELPTYVQYQLLKSKCRDNNKINKTDITITSTKGTIGPGRRPLAYLL